MKKKSRVARGEIEDLRKQLSSIPDLPTEKQKLTTREAVITLRAEIRDLMRRGYDMAEISRFLAQGGLDVAANTLRQYLTRQHKKRAAGG